MHMVVRGRPRSVVSVGQPLLGVGGTKMLLKPIRRFNSSTVRRHPHRRVLMLGRGEVPSWSVVENRPPSQDHCCPWTSVLIEALFHPSCLVYRIFDRPGLGSIRGQLNLTVHAISQSPSPSLHFTPLHFTARGPVCTRAWR